MSTAVSNPIRLLPPAPERPEPAPAAEKPAARRRSRRRSRPAPVPAALVEATERAAQIAERAADLAERLERAAAAASAPPPAPAELLVEPSPPRPSIAVVARAIFGAALGACAPIFACAIAHDLVDRDDLTKTPIYAALVAFCLLFSLPKVYAWSTKAFGTWYAGLGYAVMCEGILTFVSTPWMVTAALSVLVVINALDAGSRFAKSGH